MLKRTMQTPFLSRQSATKLIPTRTLPTRAMKAAEEGPSLPPLIQFLPDFLPLTKWQSIPFLFFSYLPYSANVSFPFRSGLILSAIVILGFSFLTVLCVFLFPLVSDNSFKKALPVLQNRGTCCADEKTERVFLTRTEIPHAFTSNCDTKLFRGRLSDVRLMAK